MHSGEIVASVESRSKNIKAPEGETGKLNNSVSLIAQKFKGLRSKSMTIPNLQKSKSFDESNAKNDKEERLETDVCKPLLKSNSMLERRSFPTPFGQASFRGRSSASTITANEVDGGTMLVPGRTPDPSQSPIQTEFAASPASNASSETPGSRRMRIVLWDDDADPAAAAAVSAPPTATGRASVRGLLRSQSPERRLRTAPAAVSSPSAYLCSDIFPESAGAAAAAVPAPGRGDGAVRDAALRQVRARPLPRCGAAEVGHRAPAADAPETGIGVKP